jgi:hypothetical protein
MEEIEESPEERSDRGEVTFEESSSPSRRKRDLRGGKGSPVRRAEEASAFTPLVASLYEGPFESLLSRLDTAVAAAPEGPVKTWTSETDRFLIGADPGPVTGNAALGTASTLMGKEAVTVTAGTNVSAAGMADTS